MKAGIIGLISGKADSIDSFHKMAERDGTKFNRSLQVNLEGYTKAGKPIYTGEAATQTIEEKEAISISEDTGDIVVAEEPEKESQYTELIIVPGEFVVVSSSSGQFAFNLLQEMSNISLVSRSELNLTEYAKKYYDAEDVNPWQVGFYGNVGEAEKGVVYGDSVFNDTEIGDVLERAQINQLGLEYEILGKKIKMTTSRSGYVEVYQPSNLSTEEYVEYVINEILPIASMSESSE